MPAKRSPHRDIFKGSLDVLVLSILADGRQHGYALQKQLLHLTGEKLTAGALYPLLHRLEADGLIDAEWDRTTARPRKRYRLTESGQRHFRRSAAEWQATIARLQSLVLPAVRRVASKHEHPIRRSS